MTLMTLGRNVSRNEAACRNESACRTKAAGVEEVSPVLGQGGAPLHSPAGPDVPPLAHVLANVPATTQDVEEDASGVPDEGILLYIHKLDYLLIKIDKSKLEL